MRRYNLGYLVSSLSPQDDFARFRIDPSILQFYVALNSETLIHIDHMLIAGVSGTFLIRPEVRDKLKSVIT